MADRSEDWLRQAQRDLEHARHDVAEGYYEWGCFSAQQAAEKAVKGLYQYLGGEAWGHAVKRLLEELPPDVGVTPELVDAGVTVRSLVKRLSDSHLSQAYAVLMKHLPHYEGKDDIDCSESIHRLGFHQILNSHCGQNP